MRALIVLFALLLGACDGSSARAPLPQTTGLPASSIGVALEVTSNGAAVLVDAVVSGATGPLRLGPNDLFVASATDAPVRALAEYAGGRYALIMPTQSQIVTFTFLRDGTSASTTDLLLPTPFTIVAPTDPSRAMSIPLGWSAGSSAETLALTASGPCITGGKLARGPDPLGVGFTLQAADFIPSTMACTLEIEVTRRMTTTSSLSNLSPTRTATLAQVRTLELSTRP